MTLKIDAKKLHKKDECLMELLATHHSVFVHLDTRKRDVVVPRWLRAKFKHQLVLQLGLNLATPIRDLKITDEGWSATLSFNRTYERVWVPWKAVYLIVGDSGVGGHWPKDTPLEARVRRADNVNDIPDERAKAGAPPKKERPPWLRVIDGGKSAPKAEAPTLPPPVRGPFGSDDEGDAG